MDTQTLGYAAPARNRDSATWHAEIPQRAGASPESALIDLITRKLIHNILI